MKDREQLSKSVDMLWKHANSFCKSYRQ